MALPTISSIAPNTLWTAGQVLTVTGTNFKTWTIPPVSEGPLPPPIATVRVTVDGVICAKVVVFSSTSLTFAAPSHDAGGGAVVVTNLDSLGAPIVGESSSPSTITYKRPDLTDTVDLERVNEAVIKLLAQQIIDNVVSFVAVDYSESPFEATMVAHVPALLLSGPTIATSEQVYFQNQQIEVGAYDAFQEPEAVDLEYSLTGVTKNEKQLVRLQGIVARFFRKTRSITIARDITDSSKGNITYILEKRAQDDIRATTTANKDDVRSFEVPFRVLGVLIEGLAGFPGENLVRKGGVVDDIALNIINVTVD